MIKIEIINSNDILRLGEYVFFKNFLTIGSSYTNDLFLTLDGLDAIHSALEIEENKLFITFNVKLDHIKVNKKITTGKKRLVENDIIRLADVEIKILKFEMTVHETRKEILNRKLQEKNFQNNPILEVVQNLREQNER